MEERKGGGEVGGIGDEAGWGVFWVEVYTLERMGCEWDRGWTRKNMSGQTRWGQGGLFQTPSLFVLQCCVPTPVVFSVVCVRWKKSLFLFVSYYFLLS